MDDRRERFEAQVLPHLDAAYAFARWLSGAPAQADDIVQEAVLRAFRGFDGLRGTEVKAWLLAIVRNCHLTALAQHRRHAAVPLLGEADEAGDEGEALVEASPGPEEQTIAADQRRVLERLMASLASEHREILILREVEDMNYREIAEVLDVPIGTVMSRLARARAALKAQWTRNHAQAPRAVR